MNIIHKSIYIINYETQQVILREPPATFDSYVAELINHISNNTSVRECKTHSDSTEVISCILKICANQTNENSVLDRMKILARRLLLEETKAQIQIRHTNTTVQKGSLIQALLFDDIAEKYVYLLAKVEHTEWVDDSDFTFKTGFSKDKKTIWKSCLFDLSNLTAQEFYAKVYSDTKAQYWSNGFLELEELKNDELNTQRAFQAIEATLGHGFRGITGPDHTIIRNSFIGYLKSNEHIDYPSMVNSILENYQPEDTNISPEKVESIRKALLEQPEKRKFDNQFNSVSTAINARIKKVYHVYEGIDLSVKGNIPNLSSIIQSVEKDGFQYLMVRTTDDKTYKQFHFSSN